MFGILNETIFAIYVLLTKLVRGLLALVRTRVTSRPARGHLLDVELMTQQRQKNEIVRRLLSCLGIEQRSRVPVRVRADQRCFKRH